ncbi:PQ-loop-domain-containing protein [Gigaspora margarita]|uniref:PQ-loop-domain-containing protein n=1 Tax=Gigaspora margarita TaxID=4874 RepID=A0A8H4EV81_GIGMA|nr:PQ-loop-domain-containing protein [Gigaspora margarita]
MENNGHQALFHDLSYVFGTIGTVLWTLQLLPQVYKNWRNESTKGLSPITMLIWAMSCLFYAVYAVVAEISIVLIIQQMIFGRKIVCGISLIFLAIDMLGASLNTLCLAFNAPPFDAYATSLYFAIFTLDLIIFILYYLLNWMHKKNFINNNNGIDNNLNNDEIVEIIIDDKL